MSKKAPADLMCPSSEVQPGARIFGMVRKTEQGERIGYFTESIPASAENLALSAPALPTEAFRIAGRCAEHACSHFDGARCRLGARVAQMLEPVVSSIPNCVIRPTCRWFREHGKAACVRCPQVVTDIREITEFQRQLSGLDPITL